MSSRLGRAIAGMTALVAALLVFSASAAAGPWWVVTQGPNTGAPYHIGGLGHAPLIGVTPNTTQPESYAGVLEGIRMWNTPGVAGMLELLPASAGHVRVDDAYFGNVGWIGLANPVGATTTDPHATFMNISMNLTEIHAAPAGVAAQMRKTMCHEFGHAISGLDHHTAAEDPGCMVSGFISASAPVDRQLPSWHLRDHLAYLWLTLH